MKNQVNTLTKLDTTDNKIVSVDSTPIKANTKYNNPKCFSKNKFSKEHHLKSYKTIDIMEAPGNDSSYTKQIAEKVKIISCLIIIYLLHKFMESSIHNRKSVG